MCRTLFVLSVLAVAMLPAMAAAEHFSTPHRHCFCKEVGPRGGCVKWTCRKIHYR